MVARLALLLLAFNASASNVLVFSTNSTPVAGRALAYLLSVNTPDYASRTDVLINPSLPNHPLAWCKVSGGVVLAMSTAESNSIVTAQTNAAFAAKQARELAAKVSATNAMVNFLASPEGRAMFAGWEATMDSLNVIRQGLAGNTNMPLLTLTQLTNAIKVRINAQANAAP